MLLWDINIEMVVAGIRHLQHQGKLFTYWVHRTGIIVVVVLIQNQLHACVCVDSEYVQQIWFAILHTLKNGTCLRIDASKNKHCELI